MENRKTHEGVWTYGEMRIKSTVLLGLSDMLSFEELVELQTKLAEPERRHRSRYSDRVLKWIGRILDARKIRETYKKGNKS